MFDSNKLKKLAQKKNLTIYRISKETGITESYINSLFNSKQSNPSVRVAYKIATLLGVKIDDLLKKEE